MRGLSSFGWNAGVARPSFVAVEGLDPEENDFVVELQIMIVAA